MDWAIGPLQHGICQFVTAEGNCLLISPTHWWTQVGEFGELEQVTGLIQEEILDTDGTGLDQFWILKVNCGLELHLGECIFRGVVQ